jgi:DNA-binding winged helix-turn-helix (wHTH) protein/tetratricopeptide (TPR) repeat protein
MNEIICGDLVFGGDFLFADRNDSERLKFTRHERALLKLFIENPDRLLSRGQILDVITHEGSDLSDRNVDFLVNRLRTKLGDSARSPRYIATQYGEGYIWIAKPVEELDAFLVIGPCFGLGDRQTSETSRSVLAALADGIDSLTGRKHRIVVRPNWSADAGSKSVSYSLDASLHAEGDRLHGALVLRDAATGHIIRAFRAGFAVTDQAAEIADLAKAITEAIWAHKALPPSANVAPTERPLELRMHDAARLLSGTPESWRTSLSQIDSARAAAPHDPTLAILRGLALYAALLQQPDVWATPSESRAAQAEIESLVLNCLPDIQDNPLLMLGAAKLLFFIEGGHFDLASRLADDAFEKSTAFAAAFSTRAQMLMCQGRFAEAYQLFDKAIELCETRSEFHIYLLCLKLTAALAADDRALVNALFAEVYALKPIVRMQLGIFVAEPGDLPPDLAALFESFDAQRTRTMLCYLYNVSARQFHDPAHRMNVMRGFLTRATQRFGADIVPRSVAERLELAIGG